MKKQMTFLIFASAFLLTFFPWMAQQSWSPRLAFAQTYSAGMLSLQNTWTAGNFFKWINNVRFVDQFPGADISYQISACYADLPSTGGICDARAFYGTQASASDPLAGVTKPFRLLLGDVTIQAAVPWTFQGQGQAVIGTSSTYGYGLGTGCSGGTVFQPTAGFTGAGVIRFNPTGSTNTLVAGVELEHACFDMTNKPAQTIIQMTATGKATVADLMFSNYTGTVFNGDATVWTGSPVRSDESITLRDWVGWAQNNGVEQTAPLMRFVGGNPSGGVTEGFFDSIVENVFLQCSHGTNWASNANSVGMLLSGDVTRVDFDSVKIGGCATGVQGQFQTGALTSPAYNLLRVDFEGWVRGFVLSGTATGSGGASGYSQWNRIDKTSFATGYYSDGTQHKSQWAATTAYALNATIAPLAGPTGYWYKATVAGTAGSSEPTWPTIIGNTVVDGTVTWSCQGYAPTHVWLGAYNTFQIIHDTPVDDNSDHLGIVYGATGTIGENWITDPGGSTGYGAVADPNGLSIYDPILSRVTGATAFKSRGIFDPAVLVTGCAIDSNGTNFALVSLTANCTLSVTNQANGRLLTIALFQDGTGSRVVTFPTNFSGVGMQDSRANYISSQTFRYSSSRAAWEAVGPMYTYSYYPVPASGDVSVGGNGAFTRYASAGGILLNAGGTNQSITLTPTGTGVTVVGMPGIVGSYNAANVQCVWSIGSAFTCNTGTNSLSTLYGLAWSYSGTGGSGIGTLGDHEIILARNGSIGTELGLAGQAKFGAGVGIGTPPPATGLAVSGLTTSTSFGTATNCSSSASPAVCGSAAAGSVAITNPATTITVNTTAVTANSQIFVMEDPSRVPGTATCNTTIGRTYMVTARVAATSFTITTSATPAANSACLSYLIVN